MTSERLAAELDTAHAVPAAWRAAFLAVPRHHFLPAQIWVDDEHGTPNRSAEITIQTSGWLPRTGTRRS